MWTERHPRLGTWTWCALAAVVACGESAAPGTDAQAPGPVVAAGGPCENRGVAGCSSDAKAKLKCVSGLWQVAKPCAGGERCVELPAELSTTKPTCVHTVASDDDRAMACAKLTHCGVELYFDRCITSVAFDGLKTLMSAGYFAYPWELVTADIGTHLPCLSQAQDCAAVWKCVGGSSTPCSTSDDSAYKCIGSRARYCHFGRVLEIDCARFGQPCSRVPGEIPFCAQRTACATPNTLTCAGGKARSCVATPDGTGVESVADCSFFGMECDPKAKPSGSWYPCARKLEMCKAPRVPFNACVGSVAQSCLGEFGIKLDCAKIGLQCDPGYSFGTFRCSALPGCDLPFDACSAGKMHYCRGTDSTRTFECAKAGMVCDKFACVFPKP